MLVQLKLIDVACHHKIRTTLNGASEVFVIVGIIVAAGARLIWRVSRN